MTLFDAKKYQNRRICVAFSGGIDSVCLLHALKTQAEGYNIALSAVHIEHGIRGEESLRDMHFCEELCEKWQIPLLVRRVDVPKLVREQGGSVEEVARAVRYGIFREILKNGTVDLVATAHHADDVAETILFRLARGTGPAGMHAITEYEGIVRPLLSVTREEIATYVAKNGLPHVEDSTNSDENYTRNYIRHTALPAFEKIHGNAARHLVEFASLAAEEDEFLQKLAEDAIVHVAGEERVPVDLPDVLFRRACLSCMRHCAEDGGYSRANIAEIEGLRSLQSGRRVSLPLPEDLKGFAALYAVREGNHIVFALSVDGTPLHGPYPFTAKPQLYLSPAPFEVREEANETERSEKKRWLYVDLDAFPDGCVVRTRQEGDMFTPFHAPRKTLKKFLTDRKIPARISKDLPVIAKGSEVYVVVGVEIADSVRVSDKTTRRGLIG